MSSGGVNPDTMGRQYKKKIGIKFQNYDKKTLKRALLDIKIKKRSIKKIKIGISKTILSCFNHLKPLIFFLFLLSGFAPKNGLRRFLVANKPMSGFTPHIGVNPDTIYNQKKGGREGNFGVLFTGDYTRHTKASKLFFGDFFLQGLQIYQQKTAKIVRLHPE